MALIPINPFDVVKGYEYANDQNQQDLKLQKAIEAQNQQAQVNAAKLQLTQAQLADFNQGSDYRTAKRKADEAGYNQVLNEGTADDAVASYKASNPGISDIEALERVSSANTDQELHGIYQKRLSREYARAAETAANLGDLEKARTLYAKAGRADPGFVQGQQPLNPLVAVDDNGVPNTVPGGLTVNGQPVTQRQFLEAYGAKVAPGIVAQENAKAAMDRTNAVAGSHERISALNAQTRAYVAELSARAKATGQDSTVIDDINNKVDSVNKRIEENLKAWEIAHKNNLNTSYFENQHKRLTDEVDRIHADAQAAKRASDQQIADKERQSRIALAGTQALQTADSLPLAVSEPVSRARPEVKPLNIVPAPIASSAAVVPSPAITVTPPTTPTPAVPVMDLNVALRARSEAGQQRGNRAALVRRQAYNEKLAALGGAMTADNVRAADSAGEQAVANDQPLQLLNQKYLQAHAQVIAAAKRPQP